MFLNVLSLLALWALDYWTLYVLPKKASRVLIILGCLVVMIALSEASKRVRASTTSFSLISTLLSLGGFIAAAGLMNQVSHFMIERLNQFHRENNADNLHRFPVRFFAQHENGIKKALTGFWFVSALYIIFGSLFMAPQ